MRAERFIFARASAGFAGAVTATLVLAGCGGSPTAPEETAATPPPLRIVADPVVTLTQGESTPLAVEERDPRGRIVTQPASSYTWTSSAPGIVSAGANGMLTAGPGLGQAIITARSAAGLTATARVWVQQPRGAPSGYGITLLFADEIPDEWRAEFQTAAARWEDVIRGDLPAAVLSNQPHACGILPGDPPQPPLTGTEHGTRIHVTYGTFQSGTTVEAVGGPCLHRPLPHPTTIFGRVALRRMPIETISSPRRRYLALHEMGHALGLVAVVQGQQPAWYDPTTNRFSGPMGLEGYRREFGGSVASLTVPGGHWPFGGDVMGAQTPRIGWASAGALMDLGYPATWYGAHD